MLLARRLKLAEILLTPPRRLLVCAPAFLEKKRRIPARESADKAGDWGGGFQSLRDEWRLSFAPAKPGTDIGRIVLWQKASVAQLAEHVLGKDEVTGSIPV